MQSSPLPCYPICLRPRYLSLHTVLFLPQYDRPSSIPVQMTDKTVWSMNFSLFVLNGGQVAGSWVSGNEHSSSKKRRKFSYLLKNCQFLKKDPASWIGQFVTFGLWSWKCIIFGSACWVRSRIFCLWGYEQRTESLNKLQATNDVHVAETTGRLGVDSRWREIKL